MRIAINGTSVGKRCTGTTTYIHGLIECLRDMGHELVVYGDSKQFSSASRIHISATPSLMAFDNGGIAAAMRLLWNHVVLPFRLTRDRAEILISPNVEGIAWSPIPQIVVVHDLIPLFFPSEAPRFSMYYRFLLPRILKKAAAVFANSEHTRCDILREFDLDPSRIYTAYNGLRADLENSQYDRRPSGLGGDSYFLFVGSFAPRKNLQTIIRAFGAARESIDELLVVVAYPDQWEAAALQLMRECGVLDRVIILRGLKNEEMSYLYRHASALFLLSEYEGFGYPPLEAMMTGTVAVVSGTTSLSEIAGEAGIKVDPHDIDAVARTMIRLSKDCEYREQLGEAGKNRAREFTWARSGEQIAKALSQVAAQR